MPPTHREPQPPRSPRPRAWALGGLALLAMLTFLVPGARATTTPDAKFAAFEQAWTGGSADEVVACVDPKDGARFRLLAYPLSGKARTMKPKQARATLRAYFKRLGGLSLVDKTPERSPANVRLYDYGYKPTGEGKRTTRLQVQLKQDGKGRWVLASVTESP